MKHVKKLIPLLAIAACAAPSMANATAVNISRVNDYGYMKHLDPRKNKSSAKVKLASPAAWCSTGMSGGLSLLSPVPNANTNLAQGNYQFGQFESSFSPTFSDKWTFSLAGSSQVKLSVSDQELGGGFFNLLNLTNLKLELFDSSNKSLGSIKDNQSLNLLVAAPGQYAFLVTGSARGILGGLYLGNLEVAPVPIGDSLPFLTAALLMLGWQFKSRAFGALRS
jgi:hypothetical protein